MKAVRFSETSGITNLWSMRRISEDPGPLQQLCDKDRTRALRISHHVEQSWPYIAAVWDFSSFIGFYNCIAYINVVTYPQTAGCHQLLRAQFYRSIRND